MKMNERIRARRKELKLTQAVLAKLVGVNRVTVTGWESGDYEPGGSNLQALAAVLKCNPHWLISGNGDPEAELTSFKPTEVFGIKKSLFFHGYRLVSGPKPVNQLQQMTLVNGCTRQQISVMKGLLLKFVVTQ